MFEFLKKLVTKKTTEREDAKVQYRELVVQAAKQGDLKGGDVARMEEVADLLNLSPGDIAADVEAAQKVAKLESLAGNVEALRLAHKAAIVAAAEATNALPEKIAALRREAAQAQAEAHRKGSVFAAAAQGAGDLERAKRAAPRVFAMGPDTSRELYLVRGFSDAPRPPQTIVVESVNRTTFDELRAGSRTLCRAPFQSEKEFQRLLADAHAFAKGARYLRRRGGKYRPLISTDFAESFDGLMAAPFTPVEEVLLLPDPDDAGDFDVMMVALKKKWSEEVPPNTARHTVFQ